MILHSLIIYAPIVLSIAILSHGIRGYMSNFQSNRIIYCLLARKYYASHAHVCAYWGSSFFTICYCDHPSSRSPLVYGTLTTLYHGYVVYPCVSKLCIFTTVTHPLYRMDSMLSASNYRIKYYPKA